MKIALINNNDYSMLNFRGCFIKSLIEKGHEVYCCAPVQNPSVIQRIEQLGAKFFPIAFSRAGANPLENLKTLKKFYCFFREQKPDMVLNYTIKPIIYGTLTAKLAGVKHVYAMLTGLGYVFLKTSFLSRFAKFLYKMTLPLNRKVFFLNRDDLDLIVAQKLLSKEKTALIDGEGIDLERFPMAAPYVSPVTFLLIARILKDKGVGEYIEAARQLKKKYPDVIFRLVGEVDENPHSFSREEVDSWIREGIIEYGGFTEDVGALYRNASVFVLPSYREGVPRTTLEAISMGRPIITTDAPGCRETVVDGENGFLVPVKNSIALAEAMEKIILDRDLIVQMGKKSRAIAEQRFDIHKINRAICEIMGIV